VVPSAGAVNSGFLSKDCMILMDNPWTAQEELPQLSLVGRVDDTSSSRHPPQLFSESSSELSDRNRRSRSPSPPETNAITNTIIQARPGNLNLPDGDPSENEWIEAGWTTLASSHSSQDSFEAAEQANLWSNVGKVQAWEKEMSGAQAKLSAMHDAMEGNSKQDNAFKARALSKDTAQSGLAMQRRDRTSPNGSSARGRQGQGQTVTGWTSPISWRKNMEVKGGKAGKEKGA
jgi:hypothetical protein